MVRGIIKSFYSCTRKDNQMDHFGLKYVSDFLNNGVRGHANYAFVDIAVNNNTQLFIDPVLLESNHSKWYKNASKVMSSFFDSFYNVYKINNRPEKIKLLSHAGEQNATRLGYGDGDNGKGNTAEGLMKKFSALDSLIDYIPNMSKPEDLTIFLPNFAEDGLSDLLTNILHKQLNEFTLSQLNKFEIIPNAEAPFWTWNNDTRSWEYINMPSFVIEGKKTLLVPKDIVRKKYLFSTGQYFRRVILERMREEGGYYIDGKPVSKKEVVKAKQFSGKHWQYDETIKYTKENKDALDEYHEKIFGYYMENGGPMTDENLDDYLYK